MFDIKEPKPTKEFLSAPNSRIYPWWANQQRRNLADVVALNDKDVLI